MKAAWTALEAVPRVEALRQALPPWARGPRASCRHQPGVAVAPPGGVRRASTATRRTLLRPLGPIDVHLFGKDGTTVPTSSSAPTFVRRGDEHGVRFAVWAPNARGVSVVGDFNQWDGRCHPMRARGKSGIWELFIAGPCQGTVTSTRSARQPVP